MSGRGAQRGYPICHCTSACRPDRGPGEGGERATYNIGRAEDIHGRPLCASWQNWSPPWDVWLHGSERLYGEPQDYSCLFAFVRDNVRWLDGYEYAAAAAGQGIRDERCGDAPPAAAGGNDDACVFVRAVPGDGNAPVVVHLLDWGKTAKPFRVILDNPRLFPGRRVSCRLLTPANQGEP